MNTKIVTIDLGERSYDIYIGEDLITRLLDFLPEKPEGKDFFIVADHNTAQYADQIHHLLSGSGAGRCEMMLIDAGEASKSFENIEKLTRWMLQNGVSRKATLLAVGGGVVGDLAGFAASVTMRGINFVQVPTTLLAQVDSSVGGKTGINTAEGKNLVGAFYQPRAVIIDVNALKTLPRREFLAGYAEVVKYGLLGDYQFFSWLEDNGQRVIDGDYEALSYAIQKSCEAKAKIVQADEREAGRRALLNLGHTFGHALEGAGAYDGSLLHGEAVAMGMVMAFDISVRMGLCSSEDYERVEEHLVNMGLPSRASFMEKPLRASVDDLMQIMRRDKKVVDGKMTFILVNEIGDAFTSQDVDEKLVRDVLKRSLGDDEQASGDVLRERWKLAFSSQ